MNPNDRRKELDETPWSQYQLAVRDEATNGSGSIAVNAVAGSGKSTTIEWLVLTGALVGSILVCAFNKHIATPMAELLKPAGNAEVCTINSHGNRTVKFHAGRRDWDYLDSGKYRNYVRDAIYAANQTVKDIWPQASITRLVDLARSTLACTVNSSGRVSLTRADYHNMVNNFDITIESEIDEFCYNTTIQILQRGLDNWKQVIDFGDQNWLPNVLNLRPKTYDWVIVDEAQDLNAMQLEYVVKCAGANGRVLAVGDPRQAMYGFTGAMPDSFDRIVARTKATVLPLSVCYRCPTSHLDLAREIVPYIENGPNAKQGTIGPANWTGLHEQWEKDDIVLCRLNAPNLELAYDQISKGVGARIRGGDLGKGLKADIKKISKLAGFTFNAFHMFANRFLENEIQAILRRNGGDDTDPAIERKRDRHSCLMLIYNNNTTCTSVDCLNRAIDELFDERNATVILSSVHKAKGAQANRIFLLQPELMPLSFATKEWQIQQEWNIKYVALTRAKKALYNIVDDRF